MLKSALETHLSTKNCKVYALFVDLSSAFDTIIWEKLWFKLEKVELSTKFINVIKMIYSNAKAKVRTREGESEFFPIKKSVLQGETLSPKLFTIFMDDLVKILENVQIPGLKVLMREIHALLYADDIVLLATNCFDLQSKINIIQQYFHDNELTVNLAKTKVIIFKINRYKLVKPKLFWCENEIEIVNKYVYLGVPFYENCNFLQTGIDFIKKAEGAEKQLHSLLYRGKIKTLDSRITLFNSPVKSVLLYCSPVWGISMMDKLVTFQNKYMRIYFHASK